ncbi:MAG: nitrate reductase molybdenum cofactor assembly chaperone [Conexivisphaerales archaeon]
MHDRLFFYICSELLAYPDSSLILSLPRLRKEAESLPRQKASALISFIDYMSSSDPIELQETYVRTFDFSEECSLYLSYSSFGVSMERGSELINLRSLYKRSGLIEDTKELPDYLPTFLKFLSVADSDVEVAIERYLKAIVIIAENVEKSKSPYSQLFRILADTIGGI